MANGLPFFHALSGCDTTSEFANHGKKSAWATSLPWPKITETFIVLSKQTSPELPEDIMDKLEHYIVLLYSRTSDDESVNSARLSLFCQMSRLIDNIPPTRVVLEQHTRRSIYQGGLIWGHCLEKCPDVATALTGDGRWMVPSSSQNGQCYQKQRKPAWSSFHANAWNHAGETVNVTERTLFALPCANVAARVMSSDLLNWNLLINLLDNWKSSPWPLLCNGQKLQIKACSV